jgi:predicted Fe-Mo cluster-binding NifX family protein
MRVGVTIWGDIVSPVFDAAQSLLLADLEGGQWVRRGEVPLFPGSPIQQVHTLRRHGVDVLICGAISEVPASMAEAEGIRLIPFTKGKVEDCLHAFLNNQLPASDFMMPGCGRRRRRRHRGRRNGRGPQSIHRE